jgi:hypothetical protein
MTVDDLMQQINETERLIAVYRMPMRWSSARKMKFIAGVDL